MTNKDKTKKYIEECVNFYKPFLDINLYNIDVVYKEDCKSTLEITCAYPYADNEIRFGDKTIDMYIKKELPKDRILHELLHIITDPLYNKALQRFTHQNEIEDERELLTDKLTLIIRNLIENKTNSVEYGHSDQSVLEIITNFKNK